MASRRSVLKSAAESKSAHMFQGGSPETEPKAAGDPQCWMSLFEPDVLASARYYGRVLRAHRPEAEKMLMFAVLEDAITCFQKGASASRGGSQARYREAQDWLLNDNSDWPFSFEKICEALDLDPSYIRAGLLRWRQNAAAGRLKIRSFYIVRAGRNMRKNGRTKS